MAFSTGHLKAKAKAKDDCEKYQTPAAAKSRVHSCAYGTAYFFLQSAARNVFSPLKTARKIAGLHLGGPFFVYSGRFMAYAIFSRSPLFAVPFSSRGPLLTLVQLVPSKKRSHLPTSFILVLLPVRKKCKNFKEAAGKYNDETGRRLCTSIHAAQTLKGRKTVKLSPENSLFCLLNKVFRWNKFAAPFFLSHTRGKANKNKISIFHWQNRLAAAEDLSLSSVLALSSTPRRLSEEERRRRRAKLRPGENRKRASDK